MPITDDGWTRSSLCEANGCIDVAIRSSLCEASSCVEVTFAGETVVIGDGRGNHIRFTRDEWDAFSGGVKLGDFDFDVMGPS